MSSTMISVLIAVVLVAALGAQYLIGKRAKALWPNFVLPLAWAVTVMIIIMNSAKTSFRDYLMGFIGFFVLLIIAGKGQENTETEPPANQQAEKQTEAEPASKEMADAK